MNGLRSSIKRRYLFEKFSVELGVKCAGMPGVDFETRWSFNFKMISSTFKVPVVINAIINRLLEISGLVIAEVNWEWARKVCEFF